MPKILQKELGIKPEASASILPLNPTGWAIFKLSFHPSSLLKVAIQDYHPSI
ncbi:MAG TPA: hypothetical protein IGR89_13660 [Oscillatoriaceae cyanobacterium M7585_C2015_266]|nr:hypothetical protein [Oscillatoriaceae cyanobacterium M7585_C2015_266]